MTDLSPHPHALRRLLTEVETALGHEAALDFGSILDTPLAGFDRDSDQYALTAAWLLVAGPPELQPWLDQAARLYAACWLEELVPTRVPDDLESWD